MSKFDISMVGSNLNPSISWGAYVQGRGSLTRILMIQRHVMHGINARALKFTQSFLSGLPLSSVAKECLYMIIHKF